MTLIERFLLLTHGMPQNLTVLQLTDYVIEKGWWNEFLDYLDNKTTTKD